MYYEEEIAEDPTREIFYNADYTTIMNFVQANNWDKKFASILDKYFWIEYINRKGDKIFNKKYLKSLIDQNAVILIRFIVNKLDSPDNKKLITEIFKYSIEKNKLGIVKILLGNENIDAGINDNDAIMTFCENGNTEVVKLLLANKNVYAGANNNYAIRKASVNGHAEVVKLLLGYKPEKRLVGGNSDKVLLADKNVNAGAGDNYAIRKASQNGHTEVVKLLLADKNVDARADNNYAIKLASTNGHAKVVKLLLANKKVNAGAGDNYAIRKASYYGHIKVVKLLLADKNVDARTDSNYAIRLAYENGDTEVPSEFTPMAPHLLANEVVKLLKDWYKKKNLRIPKLR